MCICFSFRNREPPGTSAQALSLPRKRLLSHCELKGINREQQNPSVQHMEPSDTGPHPQKAVSHNIYPSLVSSVYFSPLLIFPPPLVTCAGQQMLAGNARVSFRTVGQPGCSFAKTGMVKNPKSNNDASSVSGECVLAGPRTQENMSKVTNKRLRISLKVQSALRCSPQTAGPPIIRRPRSWLVLQAVLRVAAPGSGGKKNKKVLLEDSSFFCALTSTFISMAATCSSPSVAAASPWVRWRRCAKEEISGKKYEVWECAVSTEVTFQRSAME